jgi:glycosyltransferase involved in cell wall biosynthesis
MVPNCNKAKYLQRALTSASEQTLPSVEILLLDDMSNDGPFPIIASFLRRDHRFRLAFNEKPLKGHSTRLMGVVLSKGRFLLSLDSDDELRNQTAEIDLAAALERGSSMVEHRALTVQRDGSVGPFNWPATVKEADNVTLVSLGWLRQLNWQLWLRLIERIVYLRGAEMIGPSRFLMQNARATDLIHCGAMYPFVKKFITIEYVGYVYYADLPDNSFFRSYNDASERRLAMVLVDEILRPFIQRDPVLAKELLSVGNSAEHRRQHAGVR